MKVIFYEIHDCYYELIDNKPAIIAPSTTDKELLSKYHFIQLLDGRWVHYMTQEESTYMFNKAVAQMVVFSNDNNPPESSKRPSLTTVFLILRICSLLLLMIGGCLITVNKLISCIIMALSAVIMFITLYSKQDKYIIESYNNSNHPIKDKRYYNDPTETGNRTNRSSNDVLKCILIICGYIIITVVISAFLLLYAFIESCTSCENDIYNFPNSCHESQE